MSLKIIGLRGSEFLASALRRKLILSNYQGQDYQRTDFADGEMEVCYTSSVRGDDVFLVCSTTSSDSIIELALAADAAKRASAKSVVAVIPYFGYARQDRKSKPRVSCGAKVLAKIIESAGVDRVITIDLHAPQEQLFFEIPVDHLPSTSIFLEYLHSFILDPSRTVVATPDIGGAKRAEKYSKVLNLPLVICHKHRDKPNEVATMMLIGDVKDKDVYLFDDMIDTGGTIITAANLLSENGARSVTVVATHALLSGGISTLTRLQNSSITRIFATDTIYPVGPNPAPTFFYYRTCADLLARAITSVYEQVPISSHLL